MKRLTWTAVLLCAAACESYEKPSLGAEPIVAIERNDVDDKFDDLYDLTGQGELASGGKDFYLGIHKREIEEQSRWFLSAYLSQNHPAGDPAAYTLGTRVVRVEVQGGKVLLIDETEDVKVSDTFDPAVILDSFPVVTGYEKFETIRGSENYILFDPSAGRNEWSLQGYASYVDVEVTFVERFRELHDGVTFDKIFAGTAEGPRGQEPYAGTLGLSLRRYHEPADFQERFMPERDHFFFGGARRVPNTGEIEELAAKWHIYPGMKPIEWVVSREVLEADANFDVYEAVRLGVENWNLAFGFPVFEVRLADQGEHRGRDDLNMVVFDRDPSVGYAFADMRTNPNTGQIRGASIYFGGSWIDSANYLFDDATGHPGPVDPLARIERELPERLQWAAMPGGDHLCRHWADSARDAEQLREGLGPLSQEARSELAEIWLGSLILHEIGHTLGLRHNFKGSIANPASSTMDYLGYDDSLLLVEPGAYDIDAVGFLYGLRSSLPDQPFCTDDDVWSDATCTRWDRGEDPLNDYFKPLLRQAKSSFLGGEHTGYFWAVWSVMEMNRNIWSGEAPIEAFGILMDGIGAPADSAALEIENRAERIDELATLLLGELFNPIDGMMAEYIAYFGGNVGVMPDHDEFNQQLLDQLTGILRNIDGIRSFQSRRKMVDLLVLHQSDEALQALHQARGAIRDELDDAGNQRPLVEELLSRIDEATESYFE